MSRAVKRRIHDMTDDQIEEEAFAKKKAGETLEQIAQGFGCPTVNQLMKYLQNRGISEIGMRLRGDRIRARDPDDWNPDQIDDAEDAWARLLKQPFEDATVPPCRPTRQVHVTGVCFTETAMAV